MNTYDCCFNTEAQLAQMIRFKDAHKHRCTDAQKQITMFILCYDRDSIFTKSLIIVKGYHKGSIFAR